MTSHDREFMNQTVSRIIEVAHQRVHLYGGNYDFYEKNEILSTQLMSSAKRQEDMLAKKRNSCPAARASHAAQVQSRVKIENRHHRNPRGGKAIRSMPQSARGGDEVPSSIN